MRQQNNNNNFYFSRAQLETLDKDGYLIIKNIFTADDISNMASLADNIKRIALEEVAKKDNLIQPSTTFKGTKFVFQITNPLESIARIVWAV